MTTDPLARLKQVTKRRQKVEAEWRAQIRACHEAGLSLRVIAAAAGVSHPRVLQIVRETPPG